MSTAAVVLAAGAGSRFAGPTHKLAAPLRDRTVVELAIDAALRSRIGPVIVVGSALAGAVFELVDGDEVVVVEAVDAVEGIAASMQTGIRKAAARGHDAVVVGLGDQPFVSPEAWRRVAAATATPIAVATYDGQRGNPVRLAAEVWPLLPTGGDEGARAVIRSRPELVTGVPCPGSTVDIDTVEDLRSWS